MLQHEQTDPQNMPPTVPLPIPNAAEARVTPDELNAALKALEDRQNSTVAIGSVVDELRLNATPEQIWEQVQRQRAQPGQAAQTPPLQAAVLPVTARIRRRHGWWAIAVGVVLFWVAAHSASVDTSPSVTTVTTTSRTTTTTPPPVITTSGQTITIGGDGQVETIPVQGKDIVITGENDKITLQGRARDVSIIGDHDRLRGDAPDAYDQTGNGNDVKWTGEPHPVAPRPPSP